MRTPFPTAQRRRLALLAVLVAAMAGIVLLHPWYQARMKWEVEAVQQAAEPQDASPSAAAGQPPAPPPPVTAEAPEAEAEPTAPLPGGPRVSLGHAAGLHRAADPLGLSASAAYAVELDSGKVVLQKNPDAVLPIASLTKLMTALVVLQAQLPLQESITITDEDVDRLRNSRSRLRVGTVLTRAEALHLALMSSENRAAHALGRTFPGGMNAFVAAMNAQARALGMHSTRFTDPTGLATENQSTAQDLALLAAAASRDPMVRQYSTTPRHAFTAGNRTVLFNNSNRLVKDPNWDILLQKTGYIVEAGQCLTMHVRMGGEDIVLVLLDSGGRSARWADAQRIRRLVAPQEVAAQEASQRQARLAAAKERKLAQADKPRKHSTRTAQAKRRDAQPAREEESGKRVRRSFAGREAPAKEDS